MALTALYRGNSRSELVTFTDGAGDPIDITGMSVIFTIKSYVSDSVPLLQKTNTSHTDPTLGKTTFAILASESELFPIRDLHVEVTLIDGIDVTTGITSLEILEPVRTP